MAAVGIAVALKAEGHTLVMSYLERHGFEETRDRFVSFWFGRGQPEMAWSCERELLTRRTGLAAFQTLLYGAAAVPVKSLSRVPPTYPERLALVIGCSRALVSSSSCPAAGRPLNSMLQVFSGRGRMEAYDVHRLSRIRPSGRFVTSRG